LNASVFYYDYSDYQAFSLQGLAQSIYNKDATVVGGEIELRLAPTRGLELSANVALIDSSVKDIGLPSGLIVDREMPNAAHFQMTGVLRYGWDMLGGKMSVQASGNYMGGHFLTVLNEPANYQKGYATLDLRAGWQTPDGKFEFSVYGDNVTDTYYNIWALDVAALSEADNAPGQRSSYGARIRVNF
jgi:iron complex outermembrane receptor protein